jgi:chromate transport protein ChrA
VVGVVLVGLSPVIIGLVGVWITEITTGQTCHEGNCTWMALPWFATISIPMGGIGLIILLIITLVDSISLLKRKHHNTTKSKVK